MINKDQIVGRVEQAKGKVKAQAGKMVGNTRLQVKGAIEQVSGRGQAAYGDLKQASKDAAKDRK